MKKTLIIGASANPDRYAYLAAQKLLQHGHKIELIGKRPDTVFGQIINTEKKPFDDIHTVTLYLSEKYQPEYYDYVLSLKPQRVIFNPGTENSEFEKLLSDSGIGWQHACTLVLLGSNQY